MNTRNRRSMKKEVELLSVRFVAKFGVSLNLRNIERICMGKVAGWQGYCIMPVQ